MSLRRKFKDEAEGQPITEFVGLKSKMYSYMTDIKRKKIYKKMCLLVDEDKNTKKSKGVKKCVVKNKLNINFI